MPSLIGGTSGGTGTGDMTKAVYDSDDNGVFAIAQGGTGQTSAANAFGALKQAATDSATGVVELAIASELNTGTDAERAVTPDALAGSNTGKRVFQVKAFDDATAATTGDGKVIFFVPVECNGMNLVDVEAYVTTASTSGNVTVMVRNVTDSVDMLSTIATIEQDEFSTLTAATAPVIDATHDDVATGDRIAIDVDTAGTGAKGLGVSLTFQLP